MYLEYVDLLKKYKEANKQFLILMEERSRLNSLVLPGATKLKEVITHGGTNSSDTNLIEYTSKIEDIDYLINQSRNTRDMFKLELDKKALELKSSVEVCDKIYYYRWIEGRSVYNFYRTIGYSPKQIYRYIKIIRKNIKMTQNVTN